jgi:hypothetical protein
MPEFPVRSVKIKSKKKCVAWDFGQEAVVLKVKVPYQDFTVDDKSNDGSYVIKRRRVMLIHCVITSV